MKRKNPVLLCMISVTLLMTACKCEHEWTEATCTEPKICSLCEETEGEPLGHDWEAATCVDSKTCTVCNETEGEPLGHTWNDATCTDPKTCSTCDITEGEALGHSISEWFVEKEATCSEEGNKAGTCSTCNAYLTEKITKLAHTPGEWEITKAATSSEEGERSKICTVCSQTVETETYELTAEEKTAAYKAECKTYTYNEIARNPDDYMFEQAKFKGEVIQVIESGDDYTLRVNITKDGRYWDDTILVSYTKNDSSEPRILEDDIITMYGFLAGTHTYETVLGASVTVPLFYATYVEF